MASQRTDEELMLAYQEGDTGAFEELYARYSGRTYSFISRRVPVAEIADEIFQQTFLKLHRCRQQYNSKFPFAAWLFTICRRLIIDAARTKQIYQQPTQLLEEEAIAAPENEDTAVALPMDDLSEEHRQAIELRYGKDMSFSEMSARIGVSEQTVRKRVSRAIQVLRGLVGLKEEK